MKDGHGISRKSVCGPVRIMQASVGDCGPRRPKQQQQPSGIPGQCFLASGVRSSSPEIEK
jgi:hypothetical protein